MNCEQVRPLLAAFVDGELIAAKRREVEEHAGTCAECAALAGDYRRIGEASASALPGLEIDIWDSVEERLGGELDAAALVEEIGRLRREMAALRVEVADLRAALPRKPVSTALDLPYVRRSGTSPFQVV